jgi:hypothetical protein
MTNQVIVAPCCYCQQCVFPGEAFTHFACMHGPFHEECVQRAIEVTNVPLDDLRCPECRHSKNQLANMEAQLLEDQNSELDTLLAQAVAEAPADTSPVGQELAGLDESLSADGQNTISPTLAFESSVELAAEAVAVRPRRPSAFRIPTSQGGVRIIPGRRRGQRGSASGPTERDSVVVEEQIVVHQEPSASAEGDGLVVPSQGVSSSHEDIGDPVQATQGGSALPVQADEHAGFSFQDLTRVASGSASLADPLVAVMAKLDNVQTLAELRAVIHPPGLFEGLKDGDTTYDTTLTWLGEIESGRQNHVELGADTTFSTRLLLPMPFKVAIQTVALSEGWPTEGLALAIASNVGWLEHPQTRIKQRSTDDHHRSANIGFFHGMDPSLGKSSLKSFTTSTCLQGENIDETIRNGTAVCVDGTLKGHRTSMLNLSRSGIETDEVTSAYHCSTGPDSTTRGVHFASREKLCTFVNGERDSCITGNGTVHLDRYSFAHRVWGQICAVTKVLRPTGMAATIGFPKRFALAFHERAPRETDQQSTTSRQFLIDFHNWLGEHATSQARSPYYDNFALTMHRKTLEACTDFVNQSQVSSPLFVQKVLFADTDLCRWSNVAMRMVQYLESLACFGHLPAAHARLEMSLYEHAYAIHYCRRQWAIHHGLYLARVSCEDDVVAQMPRAELPVPQLTQKLILENPRCKGQVNTRDARVWVRNKLMSRGVTEVANVVHDAVQSLHEAGVVKMDEPVARAVVPQAQRVQRRLSQESEEPPVVEAVVPQGRRVRRRLTQASSDGQQPVEEQPPAEQQPLVELEVTDRLGRGRRVFNFRKNLLLEIQATETAQQRLTVLGVAADHFE